MKVLLIAALAVAVLQAAPNVASASELPQGSAGAAGETTKAIAADALPARIALVVGNSKYESIELTEPVNDARDLADELKRDGFDVALGENLNREAMREALRQFYGKIEVNSFAVIFFSGFSVQTERQNYLLPVDARISVKADVLRDGFNFDDILGEMSRRTTKLKIAIVDASRRNEFEPRLDERFAGLAIHKLTPETLVLYSATPNTLVEVNNGADRSVFVNTLLKEISMPNRSAEWAFIETRKKLVQATKGDRVPWISSALTQDVSFNPGLHPGAGAPEETANPQAGVVEVVCPERAEPFVHIEYHYGVDMPSSFLCWYKSPSVLSDKLSEIPYSLEVKGKCELKHVDRIADMRGAGSKTFSAGTQECSGERDRCVVSCRIQ
jgi:hypothetical protein